MWALTEVMTTNYMAAQLIATLIVLTWNFTINKMWTF